jgi:calcium permeable stress-gated cation channel
MFAELRNFIKVRQAYLTSPQHRLRASASTVLVRAVPNKYIDRDELEALFDVFPGGIRNIWINRDYTSLSKLIKKRMKVARNLEAAEADLLQKCWRAWENGESGRKKSRKESLGGQTDGASHTDLKPNDRFTEGDGISANNPHQVHHTVDEAVQELNMTEELREVESDARPHIFGRGLEAVQHGFQNIGRGIGHIGRGIRGDREGDGLADETKPDGGRISRFRSVRKVLGRPSNSLDTTADRTGINGGDAHFSVDEDSDGITATDIELREQNRSSQKRENNVMPGPRGRNTVPEDSGPDFTKLTREKTISEPFDLHYDEDENTEARWRKYIEAGERPTMKVADKLTWMPKFMNPKAKKVDTIYHCRRELAKLNKVIEEAQQPDWEEHFPKMKSAFVQFNNQAAAHMACQSIAHHIPKFMTPRIVEISPNDIIWGNMSIPWWSKYIRIGVIVTFVAVAVILWAIPVAFLSSLSQLDALRKTISWLHWLQSWPGVAISIIQGILPVILISLLIVLLGILLRVLVKYQGVPTNMEVELLVQKYFFAFAFVQYFLVISISSAVSVLVSYIRDLVQRGSFEISSVPQILAQNVPIASNYFLSNILLQSMSQSAGGILQLFPRLAVYAIANGTNKLARAKFNARTNLRTMDWGTTYPLYTTFACIALIYSVIAPMILPLTLFGFGIWWISTRYQMLYVFRYTVDTGGLLFPEAIKQLFTGLYVLELVLIGYFIIVTTGTSTNKSIADDANTPRLIPLIVIMAVTLLGTLLFQFLLKNAFDPLLKYLPISLEDQAVERDEEFERLLEMRHNPEEETQMMFGAAQGDIPGQTDDNVEEEVSQWLTPGDLESGRRPTTTNSTSPLNKPDNSLSPHRQQGLQTLDPDRTEKAKSWAERSRRAPKYSRSPSANDGLSRSPGRPQLTQAKLDKAVDEACGKRESTDGQVEHLDGSKPDKMAWVAAARGAAVRPLAQGRAFVLPPQTEVEAQETARAKEAYQLYGNIPDDLEVLTVEQRDTLVNRAFRHSALREKRPCVWIPRDRLGVSDDEVRNTEKFTTWVWISNENQVLDDKTGRIEYKGPPPDFDEVDLIQL